MNSPNDTRSRASYLLATAIVALAVAASGATWAHLRAETRGRERARADAEEAASRQRAAIDQALGSLDEERRTIGRLEALTREPRVPPPPPAPPPPTVRASPVAPVVPHAHAAPGSPCAEGDPLCRTLP